MIGRALLDSFYVWKHQTMSYSIHGRAMASVGIVLAEADLASTASGPPRLVGLPGQGALAASESLIDVWRSYVI